MEGGGGGWEETTRIEKVYNSIIFYLPLQNLQYFSRDNSNIEKEID